MKLTPQRISELAGGPGVRKIAVENFLSTLGDLTFREALSNLEMDARLYRWNAATITAIRTGLLEAYEV